MDCLPRCPWKPRAGASPWKHPRRRKGAPQRALSPAALGFQALRTKHRAEARSGAGPRAVVSGQSLGSGPSCAGGWGQGSRRRLGSPGAGSRRGRPEPQAWDRRESRRRPRGTSHLPSSPRSRPLGSVRSHLSGTSNAPRHPAPNFSSPRTGGGIVCGDFTEMLIPRSQNRRPGEVGRGHRGVRRCASLGWEPPDGHPSRNAGVSCCPPSVPFPPSPPALSWRRRTHSDRPGPAAASVLLMLKWEATDGQRALCFQRPGGDPVQGLQTGVSGASRASQTGASAATPRGPRPPAGVLSFKGKEVYLEFIHLTLWKPHWREQGSVWINRQPHQGHRSNFSSTGTEGEPGTLPGGTGLSFSAEIFANQGCVSCACRPLRLRNCDPERMSQDRAGHWL